MTNWKDWPVKIKWFAKGKAKGEFIETETMSLSHALSLVEKREIEDAKTVVALLYAAGFRAGR